MLTTTELDARSVPAQRVANPRFRAIFPDPTPPSMSAPLPAAQPTCGLDQLSLKFVITSHTAQGQLLDFGCGEGHATAAALMRGAHIYAIDPDELAIQRLLARIPSQQHRRLRAQVSDLRSVDFKGAHFEAIHAARILQGFDGAGVKSLFKKFFRWTYPNGRLFISAPASARTAAERIAAPTANERALRGELEAAGFVIEETHRYPLPWAQTQWCNAAIARAGT